MPADVTPRDRDRPPDGFSVSLVIPMYNEEGSIEHAIACARGALERCANDWEIIVVDDASTDRCGEIVRGMASDDPRIRLFRHERNRRLGATIRTGFAQASKDLVLYMDADLPFVPHEAFERGIRALTVSRADMIAAYRFDRTTEGLKRTMYSYVYNFLIGALFGWPHRDVNFSFKLIRRDALRTIELKAEGSLIDAELLVKARNLGFVIQQIGLDYFPRSRGQSTLSSPTVIVQLLRELVALYPEMRNPRRVASGQDRTTLEVPSSRESAHRHG